MATDNRAERALRAEAIECLLEAALDCAMRSERDRVGDPCPHRRQAKALNLAIAALERLTKFEALAKRAVELLAAAPDFYKGSILQELAELAPKDQTT